MFKVVSGGVCSRVYTVTLLWPGDGHYAFFVVVRVLRNVRSFKPTGGPPLSSRHEPTRIFLDYAVSTEHPGPGTLHGPT